MIYRPRLRSRVLSCVFAASAFLGLVAGDAIGVLGTTAQAGATPAVAGPSTGSVGVVLSGTFDSITRTKAIAGTVAPTGDTGVYYKFSVSCTPSSAGGTGTGCKATSNSANTSITINFGDGNSISCPNSASASWAGPYQGPIGVTNTPSSMCAAKAFYYQYAHPGVYEASVTYSDGSAYGKNGMRVLVSPWYADVCPADLDSFCHVIGSAGPGRGDREAIWTMSALGVMGSCGVNSSGANLFCPEPEQQTAPTVPSTLGSYIMAPTTAGASTFSLSSAANVQAGQTLVLNDANSACNRQGAAPNYTPNRQVVTVASKNGNTITINGTLALLHCAGEVVTFGGKTSASVLRGATTIPVTAVAGTTPSGTLPLAAGQNMTINAGSSDAETVQITGVSANSVTLTQGTVRAHPSGESFTFSPYLVAGSGNNGVNLNPCSAGTGSAAANCGLPISSFANNAANASIAYNTIYTSSNPGTACGPACQGSLLAANLIDGNGNITYNPLNCSANISAVQSSDKTWQTSTGANKGCETRGDFFNLLASTVDGWGNGAASGTARTSSSLSYPSSSVSCLDNTNSSQGRLAYLGMAAPNNGAVSVSTESHYGVAGAYCDLTASMKKGDAYNALWGSTGRPSNAPSSTALRDLSSTNIGSNGQDARNYSAAWTMLTNGSPLVGSTACPDNTGECFNPNDAITRGQAAQLAASLIVGPTRVAGGLSASMYADNTPQPVNSPIHLHATISVPAWYPSTSGDALSVLNVAWGTGGTPGTQAVGDGSSFATNCSTSGISFTAGNDVNVSCDVTFSTPGTQSAWITVTDPEVIASSASAVLPLGTTQAPPVLGVASGLGPNPANATFNITVPVFDPQATAINYVVSSGNTNSYPQLSGSVSGSAVFGNSANTEVGTVTVSSSDNSHVTLTVNPVGSAGGPNHYGPYSLILKACEVTTQAACVADASSVDSATEALNGYVDAVNTQPSAANYSTTAADYSGTPINLANLVSDPDWGGPCYRAGASSGTDEGVLCPTSNPATPPSSPVAGYTITSDASLGTVTNGATTVNSSSGLFSPASGAVTYTPTGWATVSTPSDSFAYTVRDNGITTAPGANLNTQQTSAPATVTINLPAAPVPGTLTCTPVAGANNLSWSPMPTPVSSYKIYKDGTRINTTAAVSMSDPVVATNLTSNALAYFQNAATAWTGTGSGTAVPSTTNVLYGANDLAVTTTGAQGGARMTSSAAIAVTAGTPYKATLQVDASNGNRPGQLVLNWYNNGIQIGTVSRAAILTGGSYQTMSVSGTAPAGANSVGVEFDATAPTAGDTYYLDALTLVSGNTYTYTGVNPSSQESVASAGTVCYPLGVAPASPTLTVTSFRANNNPSGPQPSSGLGARTMQATWTAPQYALWYNVEAHADGTSFTGVPTGNTSSTSETDTNIDGASVAADTYYDYEVQACNLYGCSVWSAVSKAITAPRSPALSLGFYGPYSNSSLASTTNYTGVNQEQGYWTNNALDTIAPTYYTSAVTETGSGTVDVTSGNIPASACTVASGSPATVASVGTTFCTFGGTWYLDAGNSSGLTYLNGNNSPYAASVAANVISTASSQESSTLTSAVTGGAGATSIHIADATGLWAPRSNNNDNVITISPTGGHPETFGIASVTRDNSGAGPGATIGLEADGISFTAPSSIQYSEGPGTTVVWSLRLGSNYTHTVTACNSGGCSNNATTATMPTAPSTPASADGMFCDYGTAGTPAATGNCIDGWQAIGGNVPAASYSAKIYDSYAGTAGNGLLNGSCSNPGGEYGSGGSYCNPNVLLHSWSSNNAPGTFPMMKSLLGSDPGLLSCAFWAPGTGANTGGLCEMQSACNAAGTTNATHGLCSPYGVESGVAEQAPQYPANGWTHNYAGWDNPQDQVGNCVTIGAGCVTNNVLGHIGFSSQGATSYEVGYDVNGGSSIVCGIGSYSGGGNYPTDANSGVVNDTFGGGDRVCYSAYTGTGTWTGISGPYNTKTGITAGYHSVQRASRSDAQAGGFDDLIQSTMPGTAYVAGSNAWHCVPGAGTSPTYGRAANPPWSTDDCNFSYINNDGSTGNGAPGSGTNLPNP